MPSFDTVCEPNMVEVRNAVDTSAKEIGTRFDFLSCDRLTDPWYGLAFGLGWIGVATGCVKAWAEGDFRDPKLGP